MESLGSIRALTLRLLGRFGIINLSLENRCLEASVSRSFLPFSNQVTFILFALFVFNHGIFLSSDIMVDLIAHSV